MKRLYEIMFLICLIVISSSFPARNADAELIERIVAVVNDEVILLSELKAVLRQAQESGQEVNEKLIIDRMINDILLLEQARKFSFGRNVGSAGPSQTDMLLKNYINKKIKAMIYVPLRDIETYYFINIEKYNDRGLYDVKSEIEEYLINRSLEIKIQEHINELREDARIRIQLN